jgi:N-acetylglutamate synthase-like GNAT family acetyltransferase
MKPIIRKLRDSDRKDVLEISKHIWEGHDYLPSVFNQWLKDSKSHFCGVEIDGQVVAVGNLRLIENRSVGWMEGLRVHPNYRGIGLANLIQHQFLGMAKKLHLQKLRYITGSENLASLKLAESTGFSDVLRMAVSWISKPKHMPMTEDHFPIYRRSPRNLCTLLKSKPRFIPHRILVYDWKALNNTCPNIKDIGKTHTFQISLKNKQINSLSFSCRRNSWWTTTIYATDTQGFLAQLTHNLAVACKCQADSLACTYQTKYVRIMKNAYPDLEENQHTCLILLEKPIATQSNSQNSPKPLARLE